MLTVPLTVLGIVQLVYGIQLWLVPGWLVAVAGGEAPSYGWVRGSGGVLVALAYGVFRTARRPARQDIFVMTLILACLLNSVGHLISLIAGDHTGATWFIVLPMVLTFVLAVLLWWGRQQAKQMLAQ